jgi:hypothetical protein
MRCLLSSFLGGLGEKGKGNGPGETTSCGCLIPPNTNCAMDAGPGFWARRRTGDGKSGCWLGEGDGREADFSAALLTMRPRAASVEMTVLCLSGKEQTTATTKAGFGWLTVYIPPIAKGAMDGAPGRLWLIVGEQATTTAKANAGVLRSAQNDNGFGSG